VLAVRLAETMGLFERPTGRRVDRRLVGEAIEAAAGAGIAEQIAARPDAAEPEGPTIELFLEALRSSPRPAGEIPALVAMLGYGRLEQLTGASEASLRRYAAEARATPDVIARRLHLIAEIVAIVRGSFNEFGVRRWFERPHPSLGGRAPVEVLGPGFDPDGDGAQATLAAATTLLE
jgi:hypothetical protein